MLNNIGAESLPTNNPFIIQQNVTQQVENFYPETMQPDKTFRVDSSADGTNAALVKNSAGGIAKVDGFNFAPGARYLKLYNLSRLPVVGTDVPFYTKYLPSQSDFDINFGGTPLTFSNGISFAFTQYPEDTDATGVAQGEIVGLNISYY